MGHYCWMCGRVRSNERFSGKGRRRHLCKECASRPRQERECIRALKDINSYLDQKNISDNNIARLKYLCEFPDPDIRQRAEVVLELARVKPHKRKRRAYIRKHHPDLYAKLVHLSIYDERIKDSEPVFDIPYDDAWEGIPSEERWEEVP